jgi:hypothetical protein
LPYYKAIVNITTETEVPKFWARDAEHAKDKAAYLARELKGVPFGADVTLSEELPVERSATA